MPSTYGIRTLALTLSVLVLAGCTTAPTADDHGMHDHDVEDEEAMAGHQISDDRHQVVMKNVAFSPRSMTIHAGDTVDWVNQDSMGHTVSAEDPEQWGTAGSGDDSADWMMKGDSWSHTFVEPGTYHYYCKPHASGSMGQHQGMVGTIVVEA